MTDAYTKDVWSTDLGQSTIKVNYKPSPQAIVRDKG